VTRIGPLLATIVTIAACVAPCAPAEASSAGGRHASHRKSSHKAAAGCGHDSKRGGRAGKSRCSTPSAHRAKPAKPHGRRAPESVGGGQGDEAREAPTSPAVTIAKVLATPCQNTQLAPEPANLALVRAAVLCLINVERAQNGLEPLHANADLEAAAASHGQEMIADDYFNHISPSGVTPVDRVRETGYIPNSEVGYVIGENLAWGTLSLSTPEAIVKAWIASPEHLANILESKYRDTGIDVEPSVPQSLAEGVQGGLYTQEFGVIIR
jgi:uncharacterized protein YkwD